MDCGDPTSNLTAEKKKYSTGSPPAATAFSSQALLVCEVGYKFSDNSAQNAIVCGAAGKWSTTPDCLGTSISCVLLSHLNTSSAESALKMRILLSPIYKTSSLYFSCIFPCNEKDDNV